jgi:hypothetical protein
VDKSRKLSEVKHKMEVEIKCKTLLLILQGKLKIVPQLLPAQAFLNCFELFPSLLAPQ